MRMNCDMRRNKAQLAQVLDAALTMHTQSDPVLFRGCYFAAIGPEPESRAFVAGLLRSPRGRLLADHPLTTWAAGARRADRLYHRAAWALAGLCALFCLPTWYFGVIGRLEHVGMQAVGWTGLVTLAAVWPAALLLPGRFRKSS
jgi:type VI secretion system protein ImpL